MSSCIPRSNRRNWRKTGNRRSSPTNTQCLTRILPELATEHAAWYRSAPSQIRGVLRRDSRKARDSSPGSIFLRKFVETMQEGPLARTNDPFRVRSANMSENGLEYAGKGGAQELSQRPGASLDLMSAP